MEYIKACSEGWKIFIRPERFRYSDQELGYPNQIFGDVECQRIDMIINNNRGHDLECSLYEPQGCESYPVVIYLHGNCGNRREAFKVVEHLLPHNIAVFCFDFAGTGNSDGEFISLGWYEALDLIIIINKICSWEKVQNITLWGRSMGAVTALLYSSFNDQPIKGLILDSPFTSIYQLTVDHLCKKGVPEFIITYMIY